MILAMKTPNATHAASPKRQREIIAAALACFTEKGFPATSIADICKKAGASTGSVYHHFKSKGRLAAAIYLEGIREYQAGMIEALLQEESARGGIIAIVRYHLMWVKQHPDWAKFLFQKRHAEYMEDTEEEMKRLNADFIRAMAGWFQPHIRARKIKSLPRDLLMALLLGPCQEYSRQYISGHAATDVTTAAEVLGAGAWAALGMKG